MTGLIPKPPNIAAWYKISVREAVKHLTKLIRGQVNHRTANICPMVLQRDVCVSHVTATDSQLTTTVV